MPSDEAVEEWTEWGVRAIGGAPGPDEGLTPEHCRQCQPTLCGECGGICDWQSGALCLCWTSLEGMSFADQKAVFADDCDCDNDALSIDPDVTP